MLVSYRCIRRSWVKSLPKGVTFVDRKAPRDHVWVRVEDGAQLPTGKLPRAIQHKNVQVRIPLNLLGVFTEIAGSAPTSVWPTGVVCYRVPRDRAHALTTTARLL